MKSLSDQVFRLITLSEPVHHLAGKIAREHWNPSPLSAANQYKDRYIYIKVYSKMFFKIGSQESNIYEEFHFVALTVLELAK